MPLDIVVQLKTGKTLADVATEIKALNSFVGKMGINPATGEDWFPRPIQCNPEATQPEGFLGSVNSPPDEQGYVNVRLDNYQYINWGKLPAQPTTFDVVSGKPDSTGAFA